MPEAAARLAAFAWPGNVRQLVNAARRLTVTAPGYQTQEYTQTAFTINDLTINFPLVPVP